MASQFAVWWAANSLYAVDVQKVLRKFDDAPFMFIDLALIQVVIGIVMATCMKHSLASKNDELENKPSRKRNSIHHTNLAIGCLHISAVMLTNFSYRAIGSTSTLVWKLGEPFAAATLNYLILSERTKLLSLAGVTLIVMGVMTYSVNSISMFAASPVVLSNILFPARNVFVKLSQKHNDGNASASERYSAFLYFSLPFAVCAWAVKTCFEPTQVEAFPLLLRNALVFNLYQFMSICLLQKLNALTHSLANTMKRFLGILLSAILLKEFFTTRHVAGLVMTAAGFCLYLQSGNHKPTASSRARILALFSTFVLLAFAMTVPWQLRGSEFAFEEMKEPVAKSLASESLISPPEHGTHRAYLDSLKGIRSDLYIISRPPQKMSEYLVDENDIWSFTGKNVGNLIWGRAAFEMLADFSSATKCESLHLPVCFRNFENGTFSSSLLFWPVANVFLENQLRTIGSIIPARLKLGYEALVIGAGLQSSFVSTAGQLKGSSRQDLVKDFHPNETLEFLGDMEKRSQTIMVRGDITLQSLEGAGFTNGISAGCPSLFLNKEVHLGRVMEAKYEALKNRIGDRKLKIGININNAEGLFRVLLKIYRKYPQSIFFAQGPGDIELLKNANVRTSQVRLFSDVDKWAAELQQMDVVLGGRIHGNMAGLGSSVPAFVIAPDYRVLELVERMMVPHTTVFDERLEHDFDVAELVYSERMNGTRFDSNRCEIAKLYRSAFERYGFGVSRHVWKISNIC